jgi:hypothetical protein
LAARSGFVDLDFAVTVLGRSIFSQFLRSIGALVYLIYGMALVEDVRCSGGGFNDFIEER